MEDFNSSKNQSIKSQFVDKHIYACMTTMVEYVLSKSDGDTEAPLSNDEIKNLTYFEDENGNEYFPEDRDEQLDQWQEELDKVQAQLELDEENEELSQMEDSLADKIFRLETANEQYLEIFEWWLCSHWLAKQLESYEQVILRDGSNAYWGRCTSGQAILLDLVISNICYDMGILEGQHNEWQ